MQELGISEQAESRLRMFRFFNFYADETPVKPRGRLAVLVLLSF